MKVRLGLHLKIVRIYFNFGKCSTFDHNALFYSNRLYILYPYDSRTGVLFYIYIYIYIIYIYYILYYIIYINIFFIYIHTRY